MSLRGRTGASMVLLLTLACSAALFFYISQFKKDSVQSLQARLQAMELQRLQEEKGKQISAMVAAAAERFNAWVMGKQKQAETFADQGFLQEPHTRTAQRQGKARTFESRVSDQSTWVRACLADENGAIIAARPAETRNLGGTAEFRLAANQRQTITKLVARKDQNLVLQFTVPCLSGPGDFLGVVQLETELSAEALRQTIASSSELIFLGTEAGVRLSALPLDNFPDQLGSLIGKNLQEMPAYLQTRPAYFQLTWASVKYVAAAAPTQAGNAWMFALLNISELEKFISAAPDTESILADPVFLGGMGAIALAGLLLILVLTGSDTRALKKLNLELTERLEDPTNAAPLAGPESIEWQRVMEKINALVNQIREQSGESGASPDSRGADSETVTQLHKDLTDLQRSREQWQTEKQALVNQVEEANRQNQELLNSLQAAEKAATAAQRTEWGEAGQIRIDAIINMSEDLKDTLAVIRNYISSILSSDEGKITDAQQEFLGTMINKSARLERQINDLLDISHLEGETSQMFLVQTELGPLLQDVVLNVQAQADTKQIRILQEIPSTLPKLQINSDRFGQVIFNLVQHAVRVSDVGEDIILRATESDTCVVVELKFGGTPLTEEQAGNVFTTFHGQDSKSGPNWAGTGLKFPIAKGIIAGHRGTVEIRGLREHGNEIHLSLPLSPETVAVRQPMIEPDVRPGGDADAERFDLATLLSPDNAANQTPAPLSGGEDDLSELLRSIDESSGDDSNKS